MPRLFNFRLIADKRERTFGFALCFFGIDISMLLLGWLDDWVAVDIRCPVNRGFSAQVLFIFIGVGRLPDDSVYRG